MAKQPTTAAKAKNTPQAPASECTYSVEELAQAARAQFGVRPEVVRAVLRLARLKRATVSQAKQLIKLFLERQVN